MDIIKENFYKILKTIDNVEESTIDKLYKLHTFQNVKKGTDISLQGNLDDKEYILIDGIIREYVINEKGKDITMNFFTKGFITPGFCRTNEGISILSIQALTNCIIGITDSVEMNKIRIEDRNFFEVSGKIMTRFFKEKIQTQIIHSSQPAKNRLEFFRKRFPGLENEVSNAYIASYLGITNVSLSRLRKIK